MRQIAIAAILLGFVSGGSLYAAGQTSSAAPGTATGPEQTISCDSNVSRIAFTDKIQGGQPFELWKCEDQWHLSNLGDYQIYTNNEGKPCIKNSSGGPEKCCPGATDDGEKIAAKFSCHTADMKDDANAKADEKNTLYIEPAGKAGTRSSTTYKVEGEVEEDPESTSAQKKKIKGLRISVQAPGKSGSATQDEGSISISQDKPGTSGGAAAKTNKGGPGNACNAAATHEGSFCQLPANILGHDYHLNKKTNGAVKDYPKGGDEQNAKQDGTGRNRTSAGGDAKR